jgi:hypothetical protein
MYNMTVVIMAVLYASMVSMYWFGLGGAHAVILRNIAYLLTPLIALGSAVYAALQYGPTGRRGKTLMMLSAGMGCWFVGEALFFAYEFILNIDPFPSIADVFYLAAYPLFFVALTNEIGGIAEVWKKIRPDILFLFSVAAVVMAALVFYFGIYLAFDPQQTLLVNSIAMAYGVGDLLLIIATMFLLVLAWEFRGGRLSRVWFSLFFSFIAILVADILFAKFNDAYKNEEWFYKSLIDSFFMAGYFLFAISLTDFGIAVSEIRMKLLRRAKKSR